MLPKAMVIVIKWIIKVDLLTDARSQNEMVLKKFFHEDACIRWHNTNEQFNVTEFLRANCEYPGDWSGEVERIEKARNTVITVTHVWTKGMSFHVTSFIEIIEGKIKTLDENLSHTSSRFKRGKCGK